MRRVPIGSGFAGLLNPMCVSLICTKLSALVDSAELRVAASAVEIRPETGIPPFNAHNSPVPDQAAHRKNSRRSVFLSIAPGAPIEPGAPRSLSCCITSLQLSVGTQPDWTTDGLFLRRF